jgi:hypothetical protein
VVSSPTTTVHIDNTPVGISVGGPADALSTAGPQEISATATAGPSGVAGIACSHDGAPYQRQSGAGAEIPVSGIGTHQASRYAQNNSYDVSGNPARSAVQTWTLSIRQPTVIQASFTRIKDAVECRRIHEQVRIGAHWVTATHRGNRIRIQLPAQTRTISVTRCHTRVELRRVCVHGRWRLIRVPVLPRAVHAIRKRVPFGAATAISGWLATADGTALGGQRVVVLTAPDNGLAHFTQAAVATTDPDGMWTALLPVGPSRLVKAIYGDTGTTEPAESEDARIVVPARVELLSITP